jgi:hypothetical protein
MTDEHAERIVRIESTLTAIYDRLPPFIRIALEMASTNEAGITVGENIDAMKKDVKHYEDFGQF